MRIVIILAVCIYLIFNVSNMLINSIMVKSIPGILVYLSVDLLLVLLIYIQYRKIVNK